MPFSDLPLEIFQQIAEETGLDPSFFELWARSVNDRALKEKLLAIKIPPMVAYARKYEVNSEIPELIMWFHEMGFSAEEMRVESCDYNEFTQYAIDLGIPLSQDFMRPSYWSEVSRMHYIYAQHKM